MEQTHAHELKNKSEKLEYFLAFRLEEAIKDSLVVQQEKVEVVIMQRPQYDGFDKRFYSRGLLKVGSKKYYILEVEAGSRFVFIRSKPIRLTLTWKDVEGENNES